MVGRHLNMGYEVLGPEATTTCLTLVSISATRMIMVWWRRQPSSFRMNDSRLWMLGAVLYKAFQVTISPMQCVVERGRLGVSAVSHRMLEWVAPRGHGDGPGKEGLPY